MLSLFPKLLAFGLIAPLILRVVLGVLFFVSGYLKLGKKRDTFYFVFGSLGFPKPFFWVITLGTIEFVGGALMIVGLFTQAVALTFSVILLGALIAKIRKPEVLKQSIVFYILALAISVSILFSGAGFYAIDLPL